MNDHLTEDQIIDILLVGSTGVAAGEHLRVCEACRREMESFRLATSDFKDLASTWAQSETRKSAPPSAVALWLGFRPARMIPFALPAGAVLVAAIISLSLRQSTFFHSINDRAVNESAQISADNRFLEQMDEQLRYGSDVMSVPASELRESHPRQISKRGGEFSK